MRDVTGRDSQALQVRRRPLPAPAPAHHSRR